MRFMKKIGVFTSGGDSPGMNACIRAVVRTGLYYNLSVCGIRQGYEGLIDGDYFEMDTRSVSNIIGRGGTILKTARSKRFMTDEGMEQAYQQMKSAGIEGLIAIGGDGTFRGALEFSKRYDIPVIGIPGTIDNDLLGSDFTIGFDTAVNTVIEAVDKIRDTAESHNRLFIVEVMGRDAGLIALRSGIGIGAEAILIPESKTDLDHLYKRLEGGRANKSSKIIIVAEGDDAGGAFSVGKLVKDRFPKYDVRVTVLGHIQRGGNPTCNDRVLASRLGYHAVLSILAGKKNVMVGIIGRDVAYTPFENAAKHLDEINEDLLKMVEILSL